MFTETEDEERIRDMFDQILYILEGYSNYEFNFAADDPNNVLIALQPQSVAFDILLVLLGKKKVMTFYAYENQSDDQKEVDGLPPIPDQEIAEVTRVLGDDLQEMIDDTFGLTNIIVYVDGSDIYIYDESLKDEDVIDDLNSGINIDFPFAHYPNRKYKGYASFKYNDEVVLQMSFEPDVENIEKIEEAFSEYRAVADILGGKVDDKIETRNN